jgi:hypothetical protein
MCTHNYRTILDLVLDAGLFRKDIGFLTCGINCINSESRLVFGDFVLSKNLKKYTVLNLTFFNICL